MTQVVKFESAVSSLIIATHVYKPIDSLMPPLLMSSTLWGDYLTKLFYSGHPQSFVYKIVLPVLIKLDTTHVHPNFARTKFL